MTIEHDKRGNHSQGKRLGCLAAVLLCFTVFTSAQRTLTNCSEAELRGALQAGGTILLDCDGPITLTQTLLVTNDTTLCSSNNAALIRAETDSINGLRLFHVSPGVRLTLTNLHLTGGRSTSGAAIYNDRGFVSLESCVISSNQVAGADGASGRRGGNSSFQTGGEGRSGASGISVAGAAIYNRQGTVTVSVCEFRGNIAVAGDGGRGGAGGNGYAGGGDGGDGGHGGWARGGAIFNERGLLTVSNSGFYSNLVSAGSAGSGGTNGTGPGLSLTGHGGRGGTGAGGAIYNTAQSKSAIYGVTFLQNEAFSGDSAKAGTASVSVRNGPSGADALGGALCNYGVNECVNSTFFGNLAKAGAGGEGGDSNLTGGKGGRGGNAWGGGIFNSGRAYAWNCTFSDGFAAGGDNSFGGLGGIADGRNGSVGRTHGAHLANGAGVFRLANTLLVNPLSATATYITNTLTVISNAVGTTSAVAFVCVTNIVRSQGVTTFSTNCSTAPFPTNGVNLVNGQFLRFQTNTVSAVRTIGFGGFRDMGGNLSTDRSIRLNTRNGYSIITTNAGLEQSLAANDGLLPTLALMAGSPAIDAGRSTNCPALDQRGVSRPQGAGCDAGAFEWQEGSGPPLITDISPSLVSDLGGEVTLNVTSGGVRPLTYQWFFRGLPVAGATQSQFFLANVDSTNAGNYMVAVTNALGGAISSNVSLGVVVTDEVNFNSECGSDYCTLTWQSASNYVYNIQRLDAPDETWLILEDTGDFPGTGGMLSFDDLNGPAAIDTRRYRIVVIGRQ